LRPLRARLLHARSLDPRLLNARIPLFVLHGPLTRFRPRSRLRPHILLALYALALLIRLVTPHIRRLTLALLARLISPHLRLLAILAHLVVRPLPALGNRSFALPLLIQLASLMLELALQLSLTNLPIAIFSHSLGQPAPIEYRGRNLRGRHRLANRPIGPRWTIRSIADDGRSSSGVATIDALARCPLHVSAYWRLPCKTRSRRRRVAPHDYLTIRDGSRRHAHVRALRPTHAALA